MYVCMYDVCMYVYIYACVLPASAYLTLSLALSPSLLKEVLRDGLRKSPEDL